MMSGVLAVVVFGVVASGSYVLVDAVTATARRRALLAQLGEYGEQEVRDQRLLEPLPRRIGAPVARWASWVGRALTPAGYVDRLRRKLVLAGRRKPDALDRFLGQQVLWMVGGSSAALLVASVVPVRGSTRLMLVPVLTAGFALAPRAALHRKARQRQRAIRRGLLNFVDLLAVTVEAGLGLDQALDRVAADVTGPLAEELRRLQGDLRAGAGRAAAMRALLERTDVPELRSFVSAVLQTEAFGVPIAPVLRAQSEEMRVRRRQRAQEQAQKAPVKMLIPTVCCIFPALFVVVLGPAMINIADAFR